VRNKVDQQPFSLAVIVASAHQQQVFRLLRLFAMWYVGYIPIVGRNHALLFNTFFWTILAFLVIYLHLYAKVVIVKKLSVDDWPMTAEC
jgi:hypothetical protein